jgi:hypothetical protein
MRNSMDMEYSLLNPDKGHSWLSPLWNRKRKKNRKVSGKPEIDQKPKEK